MSNGNIPRVFIGCSKAEMIPATVAAYSILQHTDSCRIKLLSDYPDELPEWPLGNGKPRTNFSFRRFLIPSWCQYRGKAIYCDSDVLVFANIAELNNSLDDSHDVYSPNCNELHVSSVMVMNCERLNWKIGTLMKDVTEGRLSYRDVMRLRRIANVQFGDDAWNSLDEYRGGETKLLHFTDMRRQPWIHGFSAHPLSPLWSRMFWQAWHAGFISTDDVAEAYHAGHIHADVFNEVT